MKFIERVKEKAKKNVKRIVLPEGDEARTVRAAAILKAEGIAEPVLLGAPEAIAATAAATGTDLSGVECIDPAASAALIFASACLRAACCASSSAR